MSEYKTAKEVRNDPLDAAFKVMETIQGKTLKAEELNSITNLAILYVLMDIAKSLRRVS